MRDMLAGMFTEITFDFVILDIPARTLCLVLLLLHPVAL